MADIAILTHQYDYFEKGEYLLDRLARAWRRAGHTVRVAKGLGDFPRADIAILHVDLSVVPLAYIRALKRYPVVLNGQTRDIRKRKISRHILKQTDAWEGPVIIKTDLNSGGRPERRLRMVSGRADGSGAALMGPYTILGSRAEVDPSVWKDRTLVVERFLPEQDARGYWVRTWVFFGNRERCTRYLASSPIIKGGNILDREKAPVPREIRRERERLGFDFGKFDFVVHNGEAALLDANRTPGATPPSPTAEAADTRLAGGLDAWLKA